MTGDGGFYEKQELPPALRDVTDAKTSDASPSKRKLTMVLFVGGITRAEISALRFMVSQQNDVLTDADREVFGDLLIATTNVITGDDIVMSMNDRIPPSRSTK